MRKWFNLYFGFSKREFNGLLALVAVVVLVAFIPAVYEGLWPVNDDLKAADRAIRKLELVIDGKAAASGHRLFRFDPNTLDVAGWQQLGLSAKQAAAILNYRNKGGRFYTAGDLKKMYTVGPALYARLFPYIYIKGTVDLPEKRKSPYAARSQQRKPVMIALNTADTLALDSIKGIGPAFARRIVKYRQRLGGFYKKEQLLEVFGLDSLKFNEVKDYITVDTQAVLKININTAGFDELKAHPYLRYKQINAIIQFRKQHGKYSNIVDLKKVAILPLETIEKLAPYISF
jgi:competence protein ComEA